MCFAFHDVLDSFLDDFRPNLSSFFKSIPEEWLSAALELSSHATVRRRRLPGDMVVPLVVGMAFYRNEPIEAVVRRLNVCADGLSLSRLPAKSGISEARQRLGDKPIERLFRQSASVWGSERYPDDSWQGLQVFGVDGAVLRTPDTSELRAHFGGQKNSDTHQSPYPNMRLVALMNLRSHCLLDASIKPYNQNEMVMAKPMLDSIPDHSLTLFDKGFYSADILLGLQASGDSRHWLIPKRSNIVYEVIEEYSEGDALICCKVSPQARNKNPSLPEQWKLRMVTYEYEETRKTILTSLPQSEYKAEDIAQLYHERWEIEISFRDIKSSMLQNELTLRSKKVELIYQEVWGILLAHNIIRREASQAAVTAGGRPQDISFKFAMGVIAQNLHFMGMQSSYKNLVNQVEMTRSIVTNMFLHRRERPPNPRMVKMSKTRYPVKKNAAHLK